MKYIKNIILAIAFLVCIAVIGLNIIYISNVCNSWQEAVTISYFGIGNLIIVGLIAVGLITVINWLENKKEEHEKKISKKTKIIVLATVLVIYISIGLIWIIVRDATPIADSMRVYEAAVDMYKGQALTSTKYFELNPQNLLLSFVFSLFFKLFHSSNLIIIKVINLIANCFTILGLYFITKLLKKDYKVKESACLILSITYIPMLLLINLTYGDLVSLPFDIFSLYFIMKYTKEKRIKYFISSVILMMLAVILRMNNLIFVIAIAIYLFLNLNLNKETIKDKQKLKELGIKVLLIIVFIIVAIIPSNILKVTLQNTYDLDAKKEIPATRYIAMGMQEGPRANGWYNETGDIAHYETKPNHEQYKDMITERLTYFSKHISYTIKFYIKKTASMWTEPLQESIWQNLSFNFDKLDKNDKATKKEKIELEQTDAKLLENQKIAQLYLKAFLFILFGMTLAFIIKNRKNISNEAILLLLVFLGGFFFHLLWEGKSRYIIPYFIVLIPLASINLKQKKINKKQKGLSSE